MGVTAGSPLKQRKNLLRGGNSTAAEASLEHDLLGCVRVVTCTAPRNTTLEAVERHRADVVLLETDASRTIAARKIAALQALANAPSVLLVVDGDDDEEQGWQGLPAVKKWTPIDTLVEQIEAAARNRPAPLSEIERAYR